LRGALVPHAPLLLPEVTPKGDGLRDIWDALGRIRFEEELVIVLSPHAERTGVYRSLEGSLSGFGLPHVGGQFAAAVGSDLPLSWLDTPLDHGVLVPLLLFRAPNDAIAIGLAGMSDMSDALGVIRGLAEKRDVFVLASAHTSARLTERAPLPYSFDAMRLESRFITEIEADCAVAKDLADELWAVGDSCSRTTLSAFGDLFSGAEGTVLAYAAPFGVGYPVVTAQIDV
jgi:hypothetical protein